MADAHPAQAVLGRVEGFWIDAAPVTNGAFEKPIMLRCAGCGGGMSHIGFRCIRRLPPMPATMRNTVR